MIREAIGVGKTVDTAIDNACQQIGFAREEVEIQVLSLPRKGFLGLWGNTPAKVRVSIEVKDQPKAERPKQFAPKQHPAESKPKNHTKPHQQEAVRNHPKQETQRPRPEQPAKKEEVIKPAVSQAVPVEEGSKGAVARDFLASVIKEMGVENCAVTATQEDKTIILKLEGDATGVVIGKRGETLDALQYLSALASNRVEGEYTRVVIDSGNYRQRRQKTLEQLAAKLSASVLRSGKNVTLEPMNPYERRIIHAAVSEIEGVKSISVGEEPNRSVVITTTDGVVPTNTTYHKRPRHGGKRPTGGGKNDKGEQKPRYNKPRGGNNGSRSNGPRQDRNDRNNEDRAPKPPRSENPAPKQQDMAGRQAPTEAANQPMYGKIEI